MHVCDHSRCLRCNRSGSGSSGGCGDPIRTDSVPRKDDTWSTGFKIWVLRTWTSFLIDRGGSKVSPADTRRELQIRRCLRLGNRTVDRPLEVVRAETVQVVPPFHKRKTPSDAVIPAWIQPKLDSGVHAWMIIARAPPRVCRFHSSSCSTRMGPPLYEFINSRTEAECVLTFKKGLAS